MPARGRGRRPPALHDVRSCGQGAHHASPAAPRAGSVDLGRTRGRAAAARASRAPRRRLPGRRAGPAGQRRPLQEAPAARPRRGERPTAGRPARGPARGRVDPPRARRGDPAHPRHAQAVEQPQRHPRRLLLEQPPQLAGHPGRAQVERGRARRGRLLRVRLEREAEAAGVAGGPHHAAGVLLERVGPQRPDEARVQVARPPCGSISLPASGPPSGTAIAFTVTSRRARSSASVPGATTGRAPGAG